MYIPQTLPYIWLIYTALWYVTDVSGTGLGNLKSLHKDYDLTKEYLLS